VTTLEPRQLAGLRAVGANAIPRWLARAGILAGAVIMLYPLLWLVVGSFKHETALFTHPSVLALDNLTKQNYVEGWHGGGRSFGRYFLNSSIVAVFTLLGNALSCSMAAYAFARMEFRLKKFWFALMLMSIMLPMQVLLVPQYAIFHGFGWINSYLPLIVPKFLATDGFLVYLLVQFIRGLPTEIFEAAEVDGCGPLRAYWQIVLPLSAPGLITVCTFTFIWSWNDFLGPLLYLNDPSLYTLPLGLSLFVGDAGGSSFGQLFAMSTLSLLPVFAIFLIFQRFIVEGISTTGLKG
jgi:multiple sugar transport system permease protein